MSDPYHDGPGWEHYYGYDQLLYDTLRRLYEAQVMSPTVERLFELSIRELPASRQQELVNIRIHASDDSNRRR